MVSVTEGLILMRIKMISVRLCPTEVHCAKKKKINKKCNGDKASHLALFLDIIFSVRPEVAVKMVLISCSVRVGKGGMTSQNLNSFVSHSHFIYNNS